MYIATVDFSNILMCCFVLNVVNHTVARVHGFIFRIHSVALM